MIPKSEEERLIRKFGLEPKDISIKYTKWYALHGNVLGRECYMGTFLFPGGGILAIILGLGMIMLNSIIYIPDAYEGGFSCIGLGFFIIFIAEILMFPTLRFFSDFRDGKKYFIVINKRHWEKEDIPIILAHKLGLAIADQRGRKVDSSYKWDGLVANYFVFKIMEDEIDFDDLVNKKILSKAG